MSVALVGRLYSSIDKYKHTMVFTYCIPNYIAAVYPCK